MIAFVYARLLEVAKSFEDAGLSPWQAKDTVLDMVDLIMVEHENNHREEDDGQAR